jgi:hypothetical protein
VPETEALFKACLSSSKTHVIVLGQAANPPCTCGARICSCSSLPSPLRHYPLVAPRSHQHAFDSITTPGFSMKLLQ